MTHSQLSCAVSELAADWYIIHSLSVLIVSQCCSMFGVGHTALESSSSGLKRPFPAKPEVEMAETVQMNSTSYSTSIQCTGLSATVLMLETTSGSDDTGST